MYTVAPSIQYIMYALPDITASYMCISSFNHLSFFMIKQSLILILKKMGAAN